MQQAKYDVFIDFKSYYVILVIICCYIEKSPRLRTFCDYCSYFIMLSRTSLSHGSSLSMAIL